MDNKSIFSWNDFGNRVLWLGNLLSRLDESYKKAPVLLHADYDSHRDDIAEIVQWQNQIAISRTLETFLSSHSLPLLHPEQVRIIAVVAFRQSLMFFCDTAPMNIARIASLKRTFDDIVKNRSAVAKLFESGVLEAASDSEHNFLKLHSGLSSFLLGETAIPIDKPCKAEPAKPSPDISEPEKPRANKVSLPDYVKSLPTITPMEMVKLIKKKGFIGQEGAIKSVCLLAYRHLNRLKKVFVDKIDYKELPSKGNSLLLGPTGCGKTFLIELLFSSIIKLPVVICDASNFVETGYVGAHIPSIFTRLIQVAGNDVGKASIGIVCLDEFDKLCSSHSTARFAGQGTTKDLKLGVQCELLKIMEASEVSVPLELGRGSDDKKIVLNTRNIPFIGCGAFSGLASMLNKNGHAIGFGTDGNNSKTDFKKEIKRVSSFENYGFIPEIYGRFSSVVAFDDLSKDELKMILERNTIQQYEKELALNGLGLFVHPDVYDHIVKQCLERGTGARGLQTALVSHLENGLFQAYSDPNSQDIKLFVDGGQVGWEVTKRRMKREVKNQKVEKEALLLASG